MTTLSKAIITFKNNIEVVTAEQEQIKNPLLLLLIYAASTLKRELFLRDLLVPAPSLSSTNCFMLETSSNSMLWVVSKEDDKGIFKYLRDLIHYRQDSPLIVQKSYSETFTLSMYFNLKCPHIVSKNIEKYVKLIGDSSILIKVFEDFFNRFSKPQETKRECISRFMPELSLLIPLVLGLEDTYKYILSNPAEGYALVLIDTFTNFCESISIQEFLRYLKSVLINIQIFYKI